MANADGFTVDLDELQLVVEGLRRLHDELRERPVRDLDADAEDIGHPELGRVVTDFCHRWQVGVEQLGNDAHQAGERLARAVDSYREGDQRAVDVLKLLLEDSDG